MVGCNTSACEGIVVTGLLGWFSGDIVGAGTIFANDMTINIAGNATLSGRTFDLAANHTATWASTSQPFSFANGAVFNNHGTFDVQNDARFDKGGGTPSQFINNGTLKKSAGIGTTTISIPFTNPGRSRSRRARSTSTAASAVSPRGPER